MLEASIHTPVKSPAHKKSKADDGANDMEEEDDDMEAQEVKDMFKSMMKMMKGVKSELSEVKTELGDVKAAAGQTKLQAELAVQVAQETAGKVEGLTSVVHELQTNTVKKDEVQAIVDDILEKKAVKQTGQEHEPTTDVLFGGMNDAARHEAEDWLVRKLKELKMELPYEVYHKGDEFKGILYAKFPSPDAAQRAITGIDGKFKISGKHFARNHRLASGRR